MEFSTTYLDWFRRLLILGALIGVGVFASTASASGGPPDVFERYVATHPYGAGLSLSDVPRPPDVSDVASKLSTGAPDAFERYATAHPYGRGLTISPTTVVNRPPDVQDTADLLNATSSGSAVVSRPPDIADTALKLQYSQASTGRTQRFDWTDWGIGIGTGIGLALLLGVVFIVGRQYRHRRVQPA
jgi:hypothetical protein